MKVEIVVNEFGRPGLKCKSENYDKTLFRRKVLLSERKKFFEDLQKTQKRLTEAQDAGDEDLSLEVSKELLVTMLDGLQMEDFELFEVYDMQELGEKARELMENGGKEAKKNA